MDDGSPELGLVCSGRVLDFVFPKVAGKDNELELLFLELCKKCAAVRFVKPVSYALL